MVSCRLEGDVLRVREGLLRSTELRLDELRLLFLVVQTSARWYVVRSSQSMAFIDLDGERGSDPELQQMLAGVLRQRRPGGGWLALADYDGRSAYLPLAAVARGAPSLLEALAATRAARSERRQRWLASSPAVELRGSLGATATLTPAGFQRGRRFLAWPDVGAIQVETTNGLRTDLLLIPRGRSGGMLDFKRYHYSVTFVPGRRKELYQAECTFWTDRAAARRGPTLGQIAAERGGAPVESAPR